MKNYEILGRGGHLFKTFILLCLMVLDVYFSFHILYTDAGKKLVNTTNVNDIDFSSEATSIAYIIGAHFIVHLATLFWLFFLVWKTFLFRFRIGTLCREFALLFIFFILHFGLYVAEEVIYIVILTARSTRL